MITPARTIGTYIAAKDGNRPWLMHHAFAPDATLEMEVKTDAITFPSSASGLEEITEILVRRFSREYENVYTFCLCPPPYSALKEFACDWLVGMSRADNGDLRAGCGRYDWSFQDRRPHAVERLKITIEAMVVLPPANLLPVMGWLCSLPYPWCPARQAAADTPGLSALQNVADYINRS